MTAVPPPRRYRIAVANRIVVAVAGGYGVAAMVSVAGAFAFQRWFAMTRGEAVLTAMWVAILAAPVAAMACVWARDGGCAWAGTGIACAVLAIVAAAYGWSP